MVWPWQNRGNDNTRQSYGKPDKSCGCWCILLLVINICLNLVAFSVRKWEAWITAVGCPSSTAVDHKTLLSTRYSSKCSTYTALSGHMVMSNLWAGTHCDLVNSYGLRTVLSQGVSLHKHCSTAVTAHFDPVYWGRGKVAMHSSILGQRAKCACSESQWLKWKKAYFNAVKHHEWKVLTAVTTVSMGVTPLVLVREQLTIVPSVKRIH